MLSEIREDQSQLSKDAHEPISRVNNDALCSIAFTLKKTNDDYSGALHVHVVLWSAFTQVKYTVGDVSVMVIVPSSEPLSVLQYRCCSIGVRYRCCGTCGTIDFAPPQILRNKSRSFFSPWKLEGTLTVDIRNATGICLRELRDSLIYWRWSYFQGLSHAERQVSYRCPKTVSSVISFERS